MSERVMVIIGALLAAAAVGAGAYHAHGLEKLLTDRLMSNVPQRMAWFDTAVRYHMIHALACVAVGALAAAKPGNPCHAIAVGMFLAGIALFSGSLYAMTFLGDEWRKLGAVTPLGGLSLILGWITLAIGAWRR